MLPLLDEAGDGTGGGSTGAGASGQTQTTGQPASTTAGSTAAGSAAAGTSSQGTTGQTGSTTGYTYKEDRTDWVPRHRLNEVSTTARQKDETIADLNRKIAVLAGGSGAVDPETQKAEAIRNAFFNLPGMGVLKRLAERLTNEEDVDRLLEAPAYAENARQGELRQWERHGNEQVDAIAESVAQAIGVDTLDVDQKTDLRQAFSAFVRSKSTAELNVAVERYGLEAVQRNERKFSETLRRYEEGDAKLRGEFVTRYTKSWVEPSRRSATARTASRTRPVPEGGRRPPVTSVSRPDKFKDLDARLDFAAGVAREAGLFGR